MPQPKDRIVSVTPTVTRAGLGDGRRTRRMLVRFSRTWRSCTLSDGTMLVRVRGGHWSGGNFYDPHTGDGYRIEQ